MAETFVKPYPVVLHPHQVLNRKAAPVTAVTDETREILQRMQATMYAADGVGLAANQVNILQRLVVMDLGLEKADGSRDYKVRRPQFYVNPEIVWKSDEMITWQEGCLSLPGLFADVERAARVRVKYLDEEGNMQEEEAEGLASVCLQHEIDHLDGIMFPQRMSKLRREMAEKKYLKKKAEWLAEPTYEAVDGTTLIAAKPL